MVRIDVRGGDGPEAWNPDAGVREAPDARAPETAAAGPGAASEAASAAAAESPARVASRSSAAAAGPLAALAAAAGPAIAAGRATRKSGGPEGTEALLQLVREARIERLLRGAPPDVAVALLADLERFAGEGADVRRALYWKAAAARVGALLGPDPAARAAALATLACFARRAGALATDEALRRATVSDLNSRVSTSDFEPIAWDDKRGVIGDRGRGDRRGDNDGLLQRFMESCGATTLQIALCEDDPVRAFAVHEAGVAKIEADDIVAAFQREVLAEMKSGAIPRRADWLSARLKNGIGRLRATGGAAPGDLDALKAHIREGKPRTPGAARALERLRALAGGSPTEAKIAEIRRGPLGEEGGFTIEEFGRVLARHLAPATGARYEQAIPEKPRPGEIARVLDEAAGALESGLDVPFGISEPGHWMLMAAVEGDRAARRFLVTDPWTGRTAWVPEKDLISGKFISDPFELESKEKAGAIDAVFLPRTGGADA